MKSIAVRRSLFLLLLSGLIVCIPFTGLADDETSWRPFHDGLPPPLNYTEFGVNDQWSVSVGGQLRVRWEHWDNFGFDPAADDDFVLVRFRLHGDLQYSDRFRIFVEGKSADATERDLPGGRRTVDVDTLALQNAFLEMKVHDRIVLRPGRQELLYGRQRLVSPLDWANARRTFDGGKVMWTDNEWKVDAFWVRPVEVRKYRYNKTDTDTDFFGVYAVRSYPEHGLAMDVYVLGLDRDDAMFGEVSAREERYTVGLRLAGQPAPGFLDFDIEGGYQFGDHGDNDIDALFFASELGASFVEWPAAPRVHVGFDYASGDRDPDDGKLKTFNQLYPLGHAYLGHIDLVGRQNVVAYRAGLTLNPFDALRVHVTAHHFRRASTEDALYNAAGAVVRAGDEGTEAEIGTELDVRMIWSVTPKTSALVGASRLWAGDFIRESGSDKDISFLYLSLQQEF